MTLLPSLFESRTQLPSVFRRDGFSDLQEMMKNFLSQAPAWAGNGKRFAVDIEELDDKYIVTAEVPGATKEDIEVTLHDRMLTVKYNKEEEKEETNKNYLSKECWQGSSSRSVMLPHATSTEEDVDATLTEGVLSVTVKKENGETIKRIAVH